MVKARRDRGEKQLQSHSQVGSDTWWLRNNMAFLINTLQYYLQVSYGHKTEWSGGDWGERNGAKGQEDPCRAMAKFN